MVEHGAGQSPTGAEAATADEWPAGTIMHTLGIHVVESGPERVVATMPVGPASRGVPQGRLHGGAYAVLAQTIAAIGGAANLDAAHQFVVGVDFNANFIHTVREGDVTAEALPLHLGRTVQVWEIKLRDDAGRLVCAARCTQEVISHNPDQASPSGSA